MASRIAVVAALLMMAAILAACSREKRERFVIPDGYAGWVCVSYGVDGAPELPTEDGYRLIVVPWSGVVETSSPGLPGPGYVDEFLYDSDGRRRHVDVGWELGGGYTQSSAPQPGQYTHKFWLSRNAKADQAKYVEGHFEQCGPFANYESDAS